MRIHRELRIVGFDLMRIIAGEFRGRKLISPPDRRTRPILDRLKEALFSLLASRFGDPPYLSGLRVVDVFAGTGSLGLEALSRGAAGCLFVERDAAVVRLLRQNITALGVQERSTVSQTDAFALTFAGARPGAWCDLVFVDPPFCDSRDASEGSPIGRLLGYTGRLLKPGGVVVWRHEESVRPEAAYGRLRLSRRRAYSGQTLTFFTVENVAGEPLR